ncbi:MAG: BON domain-containing protein [Bryobacteraceae bacterium]
MNTRLLGRFLMAAALLAGAAAASTKASANLPQSDSDIARNVRHEVVMYPWYSLWDDIGFRVAGGNVSLTGEVSQPFKKQDIERLVRKVPGVASVTNEIKVLPLSSMDDRLRLQVASAIYRDPILSAYAMGAVPAIHIIVENGHVTLTGMVNSDMEKQIAGMRAASSLSFGPVTNNLVVEHPAKKS